MQGLLTQTRYQDAEQETSVFDIIWLWIHTSTEHLQSPAGVQFKHLFNQKASVTRWLTVDVNAIRNRGVLTLRIQSCTLPPDMYSNTISFLSVPKWAPIICTMFLCLAFRIMATSCDPKRHTYIHIQNTKTPGPSCTQTPWQFATNFNQIPEGIPGSTEGNPDYPVSP